LNEASGSLKIERVSTDLGGTTLTFNAMSNRTCSVQFKSALNAMAWLNLTNVSERTMNRWETVTDSPVGKGSRFYRLMTPPAE